MNIGGGFRAPSRAMAKRGMRALDVTVAVDHATVGGKDAGEGVTIAGDTPPSPVKQWWPLILGLAALGAVWWMVKDDVEEEGAGMPAPFVG